MAQTNGNDKGAFETEGAGGSERIQKDIITLSTFITQEQTKHKHATGDFTLLCHAIQFAVKRIAHYIRKSTLINLTGLAGSANVTGDDQKKLDVLSNDIFISAMRACGKVRVLVSEEEEELIVFDEHPSAKFFVSTDPVDGSSNLDAGVSVGTIFGIFELPPDWNGSKEDLLKPGTEMLASGFTMFGAATMLVMTTKGGSVNTFTLDDSIGEFILTHPDMKIPRSRRIYSCNEGNSRLWGEPVKEWVKSLKEPPEGQEEGFKPYSARYIGSMVADAYRTLLYGGIFAYPSDSKSRSGKLRILYECAPMAQIFVNAGGQCVNSHMEPLLEVKPRSIHDRSGIFMGSYDEVQKVIDIHAKHPPVDSTEARVGQ